MIGKYLSASPASGREWIHAGYLLLPLLAGSLFDGVFACLIRWLGWPRNVISIAPISIMLGVLSYVVVIAMARMFVENFTPQSILAGMLLALVVTWPIAFVMGPIFFIYIAQLKRGRKILNDSTVFYISVLCMISELVFWRLFFGDTS
jgi:hypothetical protein